MVGILLSYWGGPFSGAVLVSGRVNCKKRHGTRSVSEIFETVQGTHGGMMQHCLMSLHADIFQGIHKIQVKVRERYILGANTKKQQSSKEDSKIRHSHTIKTSIIIDPKTTRLPTSETNLRDLEGVLSEHRWYLGQTDSPIPLPPRSSTKCSRRARRRELALQLEIAWRRWHTL